MEQGTEEARLIQRFRGRMSDEVIKQRRHDLNKKNFPSEVWFEGLLKKNGAQKFLRNWCLEQRFFGDFVWRSLKIVVELDGASHKGKVEYDHARDSYLRVFGWSVYRIRHGDDQRAMEILGLVKGRAIRRFASYNGINIPQWEPLNVQSCASRSV